MTTTSRADSQLRACVAASDVRFAAASRASSGALTRSFHPFEPDGGCLASFVSAAALSEAAGSPEGASDDPGADPPPAPPAAGRLDRPPDPGRARPALLTADPTPPASRSDHARPDQRQ